VTDHLVFLFAWSCEACGWEQEHTAPQQYVRVDGWPSEVACERCGMKHRVEYDYATDTGPDIQVFMIEEEAHA